MILYLLCKTTSSWGNCLKFFSNFFVCDLLLDAEDCWLPKSEWSESSPAPVLDPPTARDGAVMEVVIVFAKDAEGDDNDTCRSWPEPELQVLMFWLFCFHPEGESFPMLDDAMLLGIVWFWFWLLLHWWLQVPPMPPQATLAEEGNRLELKWRWFILELFQTQIFRLQYSFGIKLLLIPNKC